MKSELDSALSDFAGEPLETSKLERQLREISGVGRYSRFSYRWSDQGSRPQLVVNAEERGYAPPFLNLGIEVDGTDYNNVLFSMTGRVTALDVGAYRAEWRTDFSIGSTWALGTEYYRPFTATSRWFIAPHASAANNPFELYATSIRYDLDKFDSPIIPREGFAVKGRAQWWDAVPGATERFPLAELYVADVQRVSTRGSVFVQAYGPQQAQYHLPMDVAAALVMETFLGPVSIGGSVGDTGHRRYFQIGRIF